MKMDAAPPDEAAVATPAPVLPRRRDPGAAAPDYKLWPDKFSVELHHDGFFCGLGRNRTYLSGKVEFFDECDKEIWCQDAVDYMMMTLGYKGGWKGDVYWLPPGKTLADGLKLHILHKHSREMAAASAFYKNLVLYIDHVSLLASQPVPDDTVICGTPLTDVVTPVIKREDDTVICGTPLPDRVSPAIKREARVLNDEGGYQANSEASDSDLVDSDYSLKESDSDGDDSDYDKAVDSDVQDELMGKKIDEDDWSDEAAEDFDLQLPHDEDERKINFKTRTFVAETEMQNPVFKLLLAFSSMKEARGALREYAIKERVQIRKKRNNATRLEAICEGVAPEGPCSWKLVVSEDNREDKFVVKEYEGEHTCERVWNVREMSYTYLAKRFVDEFVGNENLSLKAFAKTIQKEVNMRPSRFKLAKAKYKALEKIHGDEKEQFNSLWDYGEELRFTNPGTSFYLKTVGNPAVFSTAYMALYSCKRGFLKGCRPVICIDGTHVKTKYGGQLLTAVGLDGNDCIYPIAVAYVEVECYSSWCWFLSTLKQDLNITNTSPFTIMSDKQKGLIKAVMQIFPNSEHRFCVRHLWQNLRQHYKGETVKNHLWACARSTTVPKWEENMEKLKLECPGAHAWLVQIPPNTWVKAFFSDFPNCDLLINNTCEVFNKLVLEAREVCVLSMFEKVKAVVENRMYTKKKQASEKWKGRLCPKIQKKLKVYTELSNLCEATPTEAGVFSVMSKQVKYVVELNMRSCTCRRWQLTGIPCHHVIACLRHERIKPEDAVSSCYSKYVYLQAYEKSVAPCRDRSEWTKTNGPNVLPPYYEKKVGRPKRCRRKDPEENERGTKISKHGVKMHCSYCRSPHHTKRNCEEYKSDLANGIAFADPPKKKPAEQQPVPVDNEVPEQEHVSVDNQVPEQESMPVNVEKRKRKPSRKKKEQEEAEKEYEARKKKAVVFDENGDIDDPTILAHITTKKLVPSHDPTQLQDSVVFQLQQEFSTRKTVVREEMPEESSYVAERREAIPITGRNSTALANWRNSRSATAAAAAPPATRGRARGTRGRGRGRSRGAEKTIAEICTARTRGRGGRRKRGAKWLLFGDGDASTSDAHIEEYQNVEINNNQTAPEDCSD